MSEVLSNRPQVRASILSFVRNLLPKKLVSAIKIILQPCCTLLPVSFLAECDITPGKYNITVKFAEAINSSINFATLTFPTGVSTTALIEGDTVTFLGVSLSPGSIFFTVSLQIVIAGDPLTSPSSFIAVAETATLGTQVILPCG